MVKVCVYGLALRDVVDDPEVEIQLEEATTLRGLLEQYPEHFHGLMPFLQTNQLMMTINQKISPLEASVKNGDLVKITHQGGDQHADGAMWQNP